MSRVNMNAPELFSALDDNNNADSASQYQQYSSNETIERKLSHELSNFHELYKQHIEANAEFAREHADFKQRCMEIQSQTEEDLSHAAALLIQLGEVEQTMNAVLAQIKTDKVVVAQLRQEMQERNLIA